MQQVVEHKGRRRRKEAQPGGVFSAPSKYKWQEVLWDPVEVAAPIQLHAIQQAAGRLTGNYTLPDCLTLVNAVMLIWGMKQQQAATSGAWLRQRAPPASTAVLRRVPPAVPTLF